MVKEKKLDGPFPLYLSDKNEQIQEDIIKVIKRYGSKKQKEMLKDGYKKMLERGYDFHIGETRLFDDVKDMEPDNE